MQIVTCFYDVYEYYQKKTASNFILEEYEKCSQLIIQQKKYKKWLSVNLETVKSIANLLNELKNKYDNKKKY